MSKKEPSKVDHNIANTLEASLFWVCYNKKYYDYDRWEGELEAERFNQKAIDYLLPYKEQFSNFKHTYHIGFEIELYSTDHLKLLQRLVKKVPKEKMIIESVEKKLKSDGKQFYLIGDGTGTPPEGYNTYELVSPVMDIKLLPYFIHELFDELKADSLSDNDIGFHIHISTPNEKKISPIALIYYSKKLGALESVPRKYVRDVYDQFFKYSPESWQYIYEGVIRKCYNLNFSHFHKENRVEYRGAGGVDYFLKKDEILKNILQIIEAYELSFNTSAEDIAKAIEEDGISEFKSLDISKMSVEEFLGTDVRHILF